MSSASDDRKKAREAPAPAKLARASDDAAPRSVVQASRGMARAARLVAWLWIAGSAALLVYLYSHYEWALAKLNEASAGRLVGEYLAVIGLALLVLGLSSISKHKGD